MSLWAQIGQNPLLATVALMVLALIVRELWAALSKSKQKEEQVHREAHQSLAVDMKALTTTMVQLTARQDGTGKDLGVLEQRQNQLGGKVDGLQAFWRSEFDKLRDEWRTEFRAVAKTLHDDLQGHRQVVHDRLDRATAAMAQQTNEFLEHLEELLRSKQGGG